MPADILLLPHERSHAPQPGNAAVLERHFFPFREGIIGNDHLFETPNGTKALVYADWTASGRLFKPVEERIRELGASYGNAHSSDSYVGRAMTAGYEGARELIRSHVNAGPSDLLVLKGNGMTGAMNWFQRMLGLHGGSGIAAAGRPAVLVTHMEHHSNQQSWLEAGAEVIVIPPKAGLPDMDFVENVCHRLHQADRQIFASITACSNVTGIETDYQTIAKIVHAFGGDCFVDFSASAPYVKIDMNPRAGEPLDAIFFSPHKFLGGPGSPGVVMFKDHLYRRSTPVEVGGGVVEWTNPWGGHRFVERVEEREDAGSPGIMQSLRAALAIRVKDALGVNQMHARESAVVARVLGELSEIPNLTLLEPKHTQRQAIVSFTVHGLHPGLGVRLLSDRFGIQARAGCSCAGTYGHYLFGIDVEASKRITDLIDSGDYSTKPGWIRLSFHPTMSDGEIDFILQSVADLCRNFPQWRDEYRYSQSKNSWSHRRDRDGASPNSSVLRPIEL